MGLNFFSKNPTTHLLAVHPVQIVTNSCSAVLLLVGHLGLVLLGVWLLVAGYHCYVKENHGSDISYGDNYRVRKNVGLQLKLIPTTNHLTTLLITFKQNRPSVKQCLWFWGKPW